MSLRLAISISAAILLALPAGAEASGAAVRHDLATGRAPLAQLHEVAALTSFGVRFHRFQQEFKGIPVLGAKTVVSDGRGSTDLVVDATRRSVRPRLGIAVVKAAAIRRAARYTGIHPLRSRARAELAILPVRPHGRLVWRVILPARVPLGSFEVLVDTHTGAVLRMRDLLEHATGTASLFDPNPVETNGSRTGLADNDDADSALLTSLRKAVVLQRLDNGSCLDGQFVRATLPSGEVCLAGRDFSAVTRSDDRFEALMAYYHLDRTQAYIQSLGFANVLNKQIHVNADALLPDQGAEDNSFYDSATGEISFGTGGVDDAEDADVIDHEYGHAIQDAQVPGFGQSQEAGAMGEGFGDYLAAAMSATFSPGAPFDACLAEWDSLGFVPPEDCLRRTDLHPTVSERLVPPCAGEIHCLGEVWSGALWDIRASLGGPDADRLVIQSQFSLTPSASFQDGSRALLLADRALYGGAHEAFLRSLLSDRGLVDLERLDDTPADAVGLSVPGSATGQLDASHDVVDAYALTLTASRGLDVRLTGAGDFDLRLYRPGTVSFSDSGALVAGSTTPGTSNEFFAYVPPINGTYYLEVFAQSGAGSYSVETVSDADGDRLADSADNCPNVANPGQEDLDHDGKGDVCDPFPQDPANDVDGDGLGANVDNCPTVANPSQRDWDRDGKGDACDRSSRVTLDPPIVRGKTVILRGDVRPIDVAAADWRVLVLRRVCRGKRCRYGLRGRLGGARRIGPGRLRLDLRLSRPGRYRFQALLRSSRYNRATSATRAVAIHH